MSDDVEGSQFDIGTASIRLVRVGNVIQILLSSSLEAKLLHNELFGETQRQEEAEIRLIAELTYEATLAVDAKMSKLSEVLADKSLATR